MKAKGRSLQCLVDSGSVASVISRPLAKKLSLPVSPATSVNSLLSATGQQLKTVGEVNLTFQLNG